MLLKKDKLTLIDDSYGIHHNQVLLWANKNFMIIAFRRTESSVLKDWLMDSNIGNMKMQTIMMKNYPICLQDTEDLEDL